MVRSKDDQKAWTRPGLCQTPEWDVLLAKPIMPAEEVNNKPKRRLLDFDESDEESNEEDPMKAELKYVKNVFHCFILILQVQKWASRGQGRGPPWFVEDQETRVPHLDKACEEVSLRSSNEHAGRAGLQLDGLVAKQEKTLFVRRKCEQPNSSWRNIRLIDIYSFDNKLIHF